jgi:transcriptional regulator GlxA family with amidase domain
MPQIRIWVYDGILASGVAGSIDVFTAANAVLTERNGNRPGKAPLLRWRVESLDGKPVQTASGQIVAVDGPIHARTIADAVIVTGPFIANIERFFDRPDVLAPLFAALRRQHERGALLASYCTGSFILAEAGLLDGGVATTHWAKAKTFAKRYPEVDLRVSEILTEQNHILCSGAVTTSLNLALRLVEKFAGRDVAAATAKMMLIDTNRVSQLSFASLPDEPQHSDALVARAQRWMEKSLQQGFSLAELAQHLAVSERTLNRRQALAGDQGIERGCRQRPRRLWRPLDVPPPVQARDRAVAARVPAPFFTQRIWSRPIRGRSAAGAMTDVRFTSKDGDTATMGQ